MQMWGHMIAAAMAYGKMPIGYLVGDDGQGSGGGGQLAGQAAGGRQRPRARESKAAGLGRERLDFAA